MIMEEECQFPTIIETIQETMMIPKAKTLNLVYLPYWYLGLELLFYKLQINLYLLLQVFKWNSNQILCCDLQINL